MADVVARAVVEYDADTRKHDEKLAQSAAKARKGGEAAAGAFARFEQTAKSIQSSPLISNLETIGSLGIQVGGTVSRLSSLFTSLVRPVAIVGQAFGPIPLAIAAVSVATIGLGAALAAMPPALAAMGTAAGEAGDRLAKLGALSAEQAAFVREMRQATEAAAIAQDRLTVSLAEGVGIVGSTRLAVTGARAALAEITDAFFDASAAVQSFTQNTPGIAAMIGPLVGVAGAAYDLQTAMEIVNPAWAAFRDLGVKAAKEVENLADAQKALKRAQTDSTKATVEGNQAIRDAAEVERQIAQLKRDDLAYDKFIEAERKRQADERKRQAEQEKRDAQESSDAERRRAQLILQNEQALTRARVAEARESLRVLAANQRLADSYAQIGRDAADAAVTADAAIALLNSRMEDYQGSIQQVADSIRYALSQQVVQDAISLAGTISSSIESAVSGVSELLQQGAENAKVALDGIVAANKKANKALQRADSGTERNRLEALQEFGQASEDAARRSYQARKNEALKAFQAEKIGKITSIAMSTAAAIMQSYAQLGPIAGTAAGVAMTAAGAIQAAVVAKQKPPPFHVGGMAPDEMDIRTKRGEVVVSQRDYGRLLDTLDRLDRRLGDSQGMEASVLVQIDGRDIPGRSTVRTGRRNPYARRM